MHPIFLHVCINAVTSTPLARTHLGQLFHVLGSHLQGMRLHGDALDEIGDTDSIHPLRISNEFNLGRPKSLN